MIVFDGTITIYVIVFDGTIIICAVAGHAFGQ